jgi:hypothetical protein
MKELTDEAVRRVIELLTMSDMEFYEKHVVDLPLEEQALIMNEWDDFMDAKPLNGNVKEDELYQKIMAEIEKME